MQFVKKFFDLRRKTKAFLALKTYLKFFFFFITEKIKLLEDSIKELLKLGFTSEQIFDVLSQDKIEIKDVLELKDANKSYHGKIFDFNFVSSFSK